MPEDFDKRPDIQLKVMELWNEVRSLNDGKQNQTMQSKIFNDDSYVNMIFKIVLNIYHWKPKLETK